MDKEKLIEQIMELVCEYEELDRILAFIRKDLLPCLPAEVLQAILVSQQNRML